MVDLKDVLAGPHEYVNGSYRAVERKVEEVKTEVEAEVEKAEEEL
jgi:hypothetical protein